MKYELNEQQYKEFKVRLLNRLYFKTGYRFLETCLKPVNRYDVIAWPTAVL